MEIKTFRLLEANTSTLDVMMVNNHYECFTLEDEYREVKVANKTRVPAGRYQIKLRTVGKMNNRYIAKFPGSHRGMLWLQDVPGFKWIYLHVGNTDKHTSGCLLVGYGMESLPDGTQRVLKSTPAYLALAAKIYKAMDDGEEIWIEIGD